MTRFRLERLLREGNDDPLPGILKRGVSTQLTSPDTIFTLDDLPIPDFSEYYQRVEKSPLKESIHPALLLETARGCWWGAKQHCTFCGLNGSFMEFRSKSPQAFAEEVLALAARHQVMDIAVSDNILDPQFIIGAATSGDRRQHCDQPQGGNGADSHRKWLACHSDQ